MLIKESELEELKENLSKARIGRAKWFYDNGYVDVQTVAFTWNDDVIKISGEVQDGNRWLDTSIAISLENKTIAWHSCSYDTFSHSCEHVLALAMALVYDKNLNENLSIMIKNHLNKQENEKFKRMVDAFEKLEESDNHQLIVNHENGTVDIIPCLDKKNDDYELSFKIGKKKMYKIKSIMEFSKTFRSKESITFGTDLGYVNEDEAYTKNAKAYIDWIARYGETIKYATDMADKKANYHLKIPDGKIILDENSVEDFMRCFLNSNHRIDINKEKYVMEVEEKEPKIGFDVSKENGRYYLNLKGNIPEILKGNQYSYVIENTLNNNRFIKFETKKYINLLNLLKAFNIYDTDKYSFDENGLKVFVSKVMSKLDEGIDISKLPEIDIEKHIPKKLSVIMKLDLNQRGNIENNIIFCYGEKQFNPFLNNVSIPRNLDKEREIVKQLQIDGFEINTKTKNMVLDDEEKTYEFLDNRINEYMEKYEVLISEEFKKKQVIEPRIGTIGVKIQNDLLSIDLSEINYDPKELEGIMEKYKLKKKYFKLKDGSFLKLEQNENMDFLDKLVDGLDIDFKKLDKGQIKLPINRSLYLDRLLEKNPDIQVNEDKEYKKLIEDTTNARNDEKIEVPKN